jgi:hypothetical protein
MKGEVKMKNVLIVFWMTSLDFGETQLSPEPESFLVEQLEKYFANHQHHVEHMSCSYINVCQQLTRDVAKWFIQKNRGPSVIAEGYFNTTEDISKSAETYIFMEKADDAGDVIAQLQTYQFWSARNQNYFIICTRVKNTKFLTHLLELIWTRQILNFVVVFVFTSVEIFSYNPFTREVMNLTMSGNLFPDKLRNLNEFRLRVSLWADWPLTTKQDDQWVGKDFDTLTVVMSMLNATFEVVEPPKRKAFVGMLDDIDSGRSEFSFNTFFPISIGSYNIEYSYPHEMNELVVLIPTDDNSIKDTSILSIFHPSVWFLFVVVIVANALTSKSVNKIDSFNKLILYYFGSLLGIPWPRLTSKFLSIKLKLVIFLLCSIIFRTAFQYFLTGSFLGSHSFQEITTISELSKSSIMIRGSQSVVDLIPEEFGLSGKFIFTNRYERQRLLQKLDRTAAILTSRGVAEELLITWKTGGKQLPFYMMEEALLPGIGTHVFHKNSPYLEKIEECLQRDREFALSLQKYKQTSGSSFDRNRVVLLSIGHLKFVFILLGLGLGTGSVVFFAELIFIRKYCSVVSKK